MTNIKQHINTTSKTHQTNITIIKTFKSIKQTYDKSKQKLQAHKTLEKTSKT